MGSVQPPESENNETSQLEQTLDALMDRIDAFEHRLREAMAAEHAFRDNLSTVTDALDSFVETHNQEDIHLTRLIEQDTQRAKDAKEGYEALAARFDETLRPNRSGRHMELLKTVSLYISIVISVVFMAPLHAILSIFEKLLRRMGLGRADDSYGAEGGFAESSARYRARQNWRRAATAARFSSSLRKRHNENLLQHQNGEVDAPQESFQGNSTRLEQQPEEASTSQSSSPRDAQQDLSTGNAPAFDSASSSMARPFYTSQNLTNRKGATTRRRPQPEQTNEVLPSSSGSEDEFVDALGSGDTDTDKNDKSEASYRSEGSKRGSDENQNRPDWACPLESSERTSQDTAFPSSEFWNISEEDIRMDFLRKG